MPVLPEVVDNDQYWRDVYTLPLAFWKPALADVAARHGLAPSAWERSPLGRNVVFLDAENVVKFGPLVWSGDVAREVAALDFVAARLPVATPRLVAYGTIDGWEYQVQALLPGTNLWELWGELRAAERAGLAYQHGTLMAALHALPLDEAPTLLSFDWAAMLAEQRAACAAAMEASGVEAVLVAQVEDFLAAVEPAPAYDQPHVVLHGDLTHLNFLVERCAGRWTITGLIDWGDVRVGPRAHEFISPGVHMYRGDRHALQHWYDGYGFGRAGRTADFERSVMARTMLSYADEFASIMRAVPGTSDCRDWDCLARVFWHIRA